MNKAELAEAIANKVGLTKNQTTEILDAVEETITATIKGGGEVTLTGFGTFSARKRAARMGVNPKTGAKIHIPAMKVPKFRAGKSLKDAIR